MKRKKMLCVFLALLMVLAISAPVFAAGADMTAPLLNSLTFSGAEVKTPGTVEATIELVEDGVGVSSIKLCFVNRRTGQQKSAYDGEEKPLFTGTHVIAIPYSKTIKAKL